MNLVFKKHLGPCWVPCYEDKEKAIYLLKNKEDGGLLLTVKGSQVQCTLNNPGFSHSWAKDKAWKEIQQQDIFYTFYDKTNSKFKTQPHETSKKNNPQQQQ